MNMVMLMTSSNGRQKVRLAVVKHLTNEVFLENPYMVETGLCLYLSLLRQLFIGVRHAIYATEAERAGVGISLGKVFSLKHHHLLEGRRCGASE